MPGFDADITKVRPEEASRIKERMVSVCEGREKGETDSEVDTEGNGESLGKKSNGV